MTAVRRTKRIPGLVEEISLEESHKVVLLNALESAESSCIYSVNLFSIDKVKGRGCVLSSGGFKTAHKGHLKVRNSKEGDFMKVLVAIWQ